ncbi:biotin--protein ligase [Schauerella aestuarii]|uniref:biotin--protein ligase n=1 Tax=Schauerella aestuarii TaxID=2511204 RepID=UPI0019258628|nr:biotin--protein ligase [Achromobacter aestuarii]MYZ44820.1 biotin--protein ligase [Achromobacter aestuarii]
MSHGEFKVPGGKLVVADVTIDAGRFTAVQISGDFFLEPPEALDLIDTALRGLPADAPEADLAHAVRQALPPTTEMFGFSPEAVATAVARARS